MATPEIAGTSTVTGFNNHGTINLREYGFEHIRQQKNAEFQHFTFLDLDTVDETNPDLWNMSIRQEQNTEERIESIQASFFYHGFSTKYAPPCYGTDGKFRDGRGRVIAAKRNEEKWLPVAVYDYEDDSERNYVTNGLIANEHPPAVPTLRKDFETAGIELCRLGELKPISEEIEWWLYNDVDIEKFFNNKSGNITKIINNIISGYEAGQDLGLVRTQNRKGWEDWCKSSGFDINNKSRILVSVDNDTYPLRTFSHILDACNKKFDPVEIILFTNSYNPKKARDGVRNFEKTLESLYKLSYNMITTSIFEKIGMTLSKVGDERPWKILGAVPQIKDRHALEGDKLVDTKDY